MGKDILKARKNLRDLYSKYSKELYDVCFKIDKMLESIDDANKNQEGKDETSSIPEDTLERIKQATSE